jgi:hypothetical protein
MARKSADRLRSQGWQALICVDGRETNERNEGVLEWPYASKKGMLGVACATEIGRMILANSDPGNIVAKFDCDVLLTDAGNEWISGAADRARGIRLPSRAWGGFWACPRAQLESAVAALPSMRDCDCPESNLYLAAFRHHGGQDFHPTLVSWPWIPPRTVPDRAGAVTLPSRCLTLARAECGAALFDFRP